MAGWYDEKQEATPPKASGRARGRRQVGDNNDEEPDPTAVAPKAVKQGGWGDAVSTETQGGMGRRTGDQMKTAIQTSKATQRVAMEESGDDVDDFFIPDLEEDEDDVLQKEVAKADKSWVDKDRVVSVKELDSQSRAYLPPAQHNLQCLTRVLASQVEVDEEPVEWETDTLLMELKSVMEKEREEYEKTRGGPPSASVFMQPPMQVVMQPTPQPMSVPAPKVVDPPIAAVAPPAAPAVAAPSASSMGRPRQGRRA